MPRRSTASDAKSTCALAQAVTVYEVYHQKMLECDRQLEAHLGTFAEPSAPQAPPSRPNQKPERKHKQPAFDVRGPLHRMTSVDLTRIEGIDETTTLIVVSEIGLDMRRWPSEKHGTAWLGLCPQVSGGKVLSSRTRPTTHRAATALRLTAASRHHCHSALGTSSRRMKSWRGPPKTVPATAYKLARLLYSMLQHGTVYVAQGLEAYEQHYRDRVVKHLTRRAKELGYDLIRTSKLAPAWRVTLRK